jgi:L-aspartate oxidase
MSHVFDVLILGSGAAGLTAALKLAEHGSVAIVTKRERMDGNTRWAQGGISVVVDDKGDSFASHIQDTIVAGDGLNDREAVRICVEEGPARLQELLDFGVKFTTDPEDATKLDLTREGGHSARRVVHAKDTTGYSIADTLVQQASTKDNITFFEHHHAIDLITRRRLGHRRSEDRCLGAYVLDEKTRKIEVFRAKVVILATGGAGKVYRYTSNPDVATGDGIAMAFRAGCAIANMEFFQFHPTCLYHPQAKNFLITEACRGEGGILRRLDGAAFMADYDPRKDLAPRDIVARAIDSELKRTGDPHVLLDLTHLPADFIRGHFPGVSAQLAAFDIDMTTTPIPVVPAAHYCCGGVVTDHEARTNLPGLLAAGEVAHTGLHGANRLASNSLLEAVVFGHRAAVVARELLKDGDDADDRAAATPVPEWDTGFAVDPDENVLVAHAWDEIRSLMWNYVGIVRSNKRLERARSRLALLEHEIREDYWNFRLTKDLIELRNIAQVAWLVVECAIQRRESRGLHYTIDYPRKDDEHWLRDTFVRRGSRA